MAALEMTYKTVSRQRRAGVLLHPTSLPGTLSQGDIGHQAYRFIEFLNQNGFTVWQMLPLGPTHEDKSPYQCLSSHAGNPLLISLDWLTDKKWLKQEDINVLTKSENFRLQCLLDAGDYFYKSVSQDWHNLLNDFSIKHAFWLDDFALFMAFKKKYNHRPWYEWPENIRAREKKALESAVVELEDDIKQIKFEQFVFFTQWHEIRHYAKDHKVELFGDIPLFVAHDSADVWAKRELFLMNSDGNMPFVAGVPPDAFSDTGQRWGNPLYNWDYMQATQFCWWKERFTTQLELFDLLRIDHFRGLEACWQIPAGDETAENGSWVNVPGDKLLNELFASFDRLPLIAEDLGVITKEVIKLKKTFNLPGMKVLQFAFDGNNGNPHLPHFHEFADVVYSGTHDNDTTLGWSYNEENYNKPFFEDYTGYKVTTNEESVLAIIRMAMSSVSFMAILPMQDILMLDSSARMNTPGTVDNNWRWRFGWDEIKPDMLEIVNKFLTLYRR